MSTFTNTTTATPKSAIPRRSAPLVCLAGAAAAVAAVPLLGEATGEDGLAVAEGLINSAGRIQGAAMLAMLASAALLLAAVRLGRRIGGTNGAVATIAGSAVAVLLAGYYAAYAAGAVVGSYLLDEVSAGLGEGTLVVVNLVEMTRYAPGLALVVAALVARKALGKPLAISAGVLLLVTVIPFTTWVAAILVPLWLGVAGAMSEPTASETG